MEVDELAKKLEEHPDHSGCCPVCRRATAETWAAFQGIAGAVGAMMTPGRGGKMRGPLGMLAAVIRGRGNVYESEEEVPQVQVESEPAPGPRFAGERFPGPVRGAETHTHPELGWTDAFTHAHLQADVAHTHDASGYHVLSGENGQDAASPPEPESEPRPKPKAKRKAPRGR